jgi:3-methyladenine DNA glycosylase AlkD
MEYQEIIKKLESIKNPRNAEGMARFGIKPKTKVLGVSMPEIRKIARQIGTDHKMAGKLFDSKIHEARILATIIADKEKLTEVEMEKWVKTFDSWDIVDQCCMNLFDKMELKRINKKISEWAKRDEEFVRRTAFSLIAAFAFHDKKTDDKVFLRFFPLIEKYSIDERNFVKKAVNWALRGIGKRNKKLNAEAIKLAKEISKIGEKNNLKSAKWIANNALAEIASEKYQSRLK